MDHVTTASLDQPDLDELAVFVAEAIDRGDVESAWDVTRELEESLGLWDGSPCPPAAVIGRRFARAHRHALYRA